MSHWKDSTWTYHTAASHDNATAFRRHKTVAALRELYAERNWK